MIALLLVLIQDPGVDQRLNAAVDPALRFVDDAGRTLRLGERFGARPLILAPVYYRCPRLCRQVLNGLATALKPIDLTPGTDFDVIAFSIDPGETPSLAAAAKAAVVRRYGRAGSDGGWRFLTGPAEEVRDLADALGFRYRRQPSGEFAHAAALIILTPEGRISRYFLGLEPPSRDLRLALVEASEGRVGTVADRLALLCLRWDPASGRYGFAALGAVRVGGGVMLLALGGWIAWALRKGRT